VSGSELQAVWLSTHRPAKEGKNWHRVGERWEYTTNPPVPLPDKANFSMPVASNWRTAPAKPERLLAPIVVKPVAPLSRRSQKIDLTSRRGC